MLNISRALRLVTLSALVLGAVLAEDAVANGDSGVPAAAKGPAGAQDAEAHLDTAPAPSSGDGVEPAVADNAAGAAKPAPDDATEAKRRDDTKEAGSADSVQAEGADADAVGAPAEDGNEEKDEDGGQAGDGLYFFVKSTGPKRCFVVSQGEGKFHVHFDFPEAEQGKKVELELRNLPLQGPRRKRFDRKPIDSKTIETKHGSLQFQLKTSGSHSLCAVTDSTHEHGLRLSLDLDTGTRDSAYKKKQKMYKLDDIQISMIQLRDRAKDLLREADFSKKLETEYHKNVLRLNREVLWWPISQVVMLLIMGFFQVRHLKKFFKNKRLV